MFKKKKHKSKEELIFEAEEKKKEVVRKDFIDNKLLPLIKEITTNLEDAQTVAQAVASSIYQIFQSKAREYLVKDLKINEMINKNKPEFTYRYEKMFELLGEQTVDDSIRMCNGLFSEVNRVIWEESKNKKIDEFLNKDEPKLEKKDS